jgi:hypothetical protein
MTTAPVPAQPRPDPAGSAPAFPPQLPRALVRLALAVGLVASLWWLRSTVARVARSQPPAAVGATTAARAPVDFELVMDWYYRSQLWEPREEVEFQLGPPTLGHVEGPRLAQVETYWADYFSPPARVPRPRVWVRWVDPRDPRRSVTVLFGNGKVYHKEKAGF